MSNITQRIISYAKSIEKRYNPENDVIPNAPAVTYVDYELVNMIEMLVQVVDDLQDQIDNLKGE
jgi:hypothetical protein